MTLTKLLATTAGLGVMIFGLLVATPLPSHAQDSSAVAGAKRCTAYWNAHKADLRAQGKTKKAFMGPCLSGAWMFY
jgi:hypothetical protein